MSGTHVGVECCRRNEDEKLRSGRGAWEEEVARRSCDLDVCDHMQRKVDMTMATKASPTHEHKLHFALE